ncbi:MAG: hypothetical protein R3E65_03145 [Steroidobacteraceae bacterium]
MTSFWISCFAMNGPTFGWLKMLSSAAARSCVPPCPAGSRPFAEHDARVVQQLLLARLVLLGIQPHRQHLVVARDRRKLRPDVVERAVRIGRRACPLPAREHARETLDDGLVIGRNRLAGRIEARRAVGVELDEPDREQLHQLARVVLVGAQVRARHGALVAEHRQVHTHRRMQRDVLEQHPEIAEGVAREHVVEVGGRETEVLQRPNLRDHHDLRQREGDALAQLVLAHEGVLEPLLEPRRVQLVEVEIGTGRQSDIGRFDVGPQRRGGLGDLRIDPACIRIGNIAQTDQALRFGFSRAQRGLVQEAVGLCLGDGRWRGWWRWRRWPATRAGIASPAAGGRDQCERRRSDQPDHATAGTVASCHVSHAWTSWSPQSRRWPVQAITSRRADG